MTTSDTTAERLPIELRTEALESILVERNIVDPKVMDTFIKMYEQDIGPMNGAKVVAKAWTDPEYKARLLEDGTGSIAEMGFKGPQGEHIVVLENTPDTHNVVVAPCARATRGPCWACRRAGTRTPPTAPGWCASPAPCWARWGWTWTTRSTSRSGTPAPRSATWCCPSGRPGTESLSEEELAALVTRDAMVGVAKVQAP